MIAKTNHEQPLNNKSTNTFYACTKFVKQIAS